MAKKLTTEEFIAKARSVHGDKYGYNNVNYVSTINKIWITCSVHKDFEQCPHMHLRGRGCPHCVNNQLSNTEVFIEKAKKIHVDKYKYYKVIYLNSKKPVCIICPIHKHFNQTPNMHLQGRGCPDCGKITKSKSIRLNIRKFIEKARKIHAKKYKYNNVNYVSTGRKVFITCSFHGDFEQSPHMHLRGRGCPICKGITISEKQRSNTNKFIEKARLVHGDTYSYGSVDYVDSKIKIWITCPTHKDFEQTPNSHLQGIGCPTCYAPKGESAIITILDSLNIFYKHQATFDWGINKITSKPYKYDIGLLKNNTVIEFHGLQHYISNTRWNNIKAKECSITNKEALTIQQTTDKTKIRLANENGYDLISFDCRNYYKLKDGKPIGKIRVKPLKKDLLAELKRLGVPV